ncbi:XkdX family protein [Lactobacillus hominis]|uniref:XkdX family protein n=2 Tax=Lactobacillus hominis TaxID=1203033 RepID=UPI0023F4B2AD|nr:XkdX family protein [Lactobacillus hominis]
MFNFNFDWTASMKAMKALVTQSYEWGAPIEGFVKTGAITAKDYKEITGDTYEAGTSTSVEKPKA